MSIISTSTAKYLQYRADVVLWFVLGLYFLTAALVLQFYGTWSWYWLMALCAVFRAFYKNNLQQVKTDGTGVQFVWLAVAFLFWAVAFYYSLSIYYAQPRSLVDPATGQPRFTLWDIMFTQTIDSLMEFFQNLFSDDTRSLSRFFWGSRIGSMYLLGLALLASSMRELFFERPARPVSTLAVSGTFGDHDAMPPQELWDEASITRQLLQLRDQQPALITHYIESVKTRWIVRQDDRTAQIRLQFLKSLVEQLKLAKEYQLLVDDLQLHSLEREKRIKTLELDTHELDLKKTGLSRKEELAALKEQKQTELEIAELEQKIQAIKNPPKPVPPPRQPPVDEQVAAQEAKIKRFQQESAERQRSAGSPPEAQKWKVFYEDLINDAQEELKKLLRRR